MLKMKSHCERCGIAVPSEEPAFICSLESTFCSRCAEDLRHCCPSCRDELVVRPRRTADPGGARAAAESLAQRVVDQVRELTQPRAHPFTSVERVIPAPAAAVFDVLASPDRHPEIDGSDTLQGLPLGPDRLELGSAFSMGMRVQGLQYRSVNTVVEFEPDRRIAWQTYGEVGGHRIVGGQIWRYELERHDDGTLVRHTYDWSTAMAARFTIELPGFPERFERTGPLSLERLERAVLGGRDAHGGQPGEPD